MRNQNHENQGRGAEDIHQGMGNNQVDNLFIFQSSLSKRERVSYSVGEGFVRDIKDFDLDVRDLQQFRKCCEAVCQCIPRRFINQRLQFTQPIKINEFTRKRRPLSQAAKLVEAKEGGGGLNSGGFYGDVVLQLEGGHFAHRLFCAQALQNVLDVHCAQSGSVREKDREVMCVDAEDIFVSKRASNAVGRKGPVRAA